MKKMIFCIIPVIIILMGCASSGGTAMAETNSNSPGMDLDGAIREASAQMGENLPGGTKVALVSVASSSAQLSEYVISRLEAALVNGKRLVVVDRANLDKVREEQGFQLSGEVDDDSAKSIGKLLGAGAIVTGAFTDLGDVYSLTLKAINIETATVAVSYPADIVQSKRIETLLASGGGAAGTGTKTAQAGGSAPSVAQTVTSAPAVQAPAVPPAPTYKIGDTGPAGGLIFYDKGNNSGGWRYLEAAPAENEFKSVWGLNRIYVGGNGDSAAESPEVGKGKANTEAIVTYLQKRGETSGAARSCVRLNINGYSDWFLPSKDELYWMYVNLKEEGIGDFSDDLYWSSTADKYKSWARRFSDGSQVKRQNRDDTSSVRAARTF
jgi:hypothetical protein